MIFDASIRQILPMRFTATGTKSEFNVGHFAVILRA
jgi:hypothetical protein